MMKRSIFSFLCLTVLLLSLGTVYGQDQPAITIWTKFNSDNPQNAQDEWTKATIESYKSETGNDVANVFQPYDQINSKLNLAVQSGGDVPDMSYVDGQFLGFYDNNGALMDLTDWIKEQSWFGDLTAAAIGSCTTPDGRILCVPTATPGSLVYYWKSYYPDGFPTTAEQLATEAARLKADGKYAITFHGTEVFGIEVSYYSLIKSAGAAINNEQGRAAWANPEMVKVIDYVRGLFAEGYVPEIALAGGFDYETVFKEGNAGALLAGSWSYVFEFPVTTPDGKFYDLGADSILTAAKDGFADFAPPLAFEGGTPASNVYATAWGIPEGSANVDAAKAFINYTMQSEINSEFGVSYGALPSLVSARDVDTFKTDYWQKVAAIQDEYGTPLPYLVDYDRGMVALADVFSKCLTDPSLDAMQVLQDAQDNYNNSLQ